jgi:multidrug efflux pump subunit AcrA (membrane-fusion protein)
LYLKKLGILLPIAALMLFGTSCFLLPKEAEIPELPLVTPYDGSDYRTTNVIGGDMELTKTVTCTYQAMQVVHYSFPVTGAPFGKIYVELGDQVTSETLLAEMDVSSIDTQIKNCEYTIQTLGIQLGEAKKAYELALKTEELSGSMSTASSDARAASVQYLSALLDIQRLKLQEFQEDKKAKQLFADIDGTVTYVKNITPTSMTIDGEKVVTLTDDSNSAFVAYTDNRDTFPVGLEVDIQCDDAVYRSVVTTPEELGLEPDDGTQRSGETVAIYFSIIGAETPTAGNTKGKIELMLDERRDVLMVSSSAVIQVNGKHMVYLQNADGSIAITPVETGLETTRYIEITSGLSEGDCVIIS